VPNPDTHTGIACPPLSGPSFFGWQHRSACTWLLLPYTFEHLRNACGKCQPLTAFVTVTSLRELCALEKITTASKPLKYQGIALEIVLLHISLFPKIESHD